MNYIFLLVFILSLFFADYAQIHGTRQIKIDSLDQPTIHLEWNLNPDKSEITFSGFVQSTTCWFGLGLAPNRVWATSDKVKGKPGTGPWSIAMVDASITVVMVDCPDSPGKIITSKKGKPIENGNTAPIPLEQTYATLDADSTFRDEEGLHFKFTKKLEKQGENDAAIVDDVMNVITAYRDNSTSFGYHGPTRKGFQVNFWDPSWDVQITPDTLVSSKPIGAIDGKMKTTYLIDRANNLMTFIVRAPTKGWIGIGFKPDSSRGMGGGFLAVCEPGLPGQLSNHYATKNGFPPVVDTLYTFHSYHYNPIDEYGSFTFSRTLDNGKQEKNPPIRLEDNMENYILFAYAQNDDAKLKFHGENHDIVKVELGSTKKSDNPWYTILEYAHGITMMLAWMGSAFVSTFIGRYGRVKLSGKGRGFSRLVLWFGTYHALFAIATILLTFLGFIFILIRQSTVLPASKVFNVWNHPHTMMGFTIILGCIVQAVLGFVSAALFDFNGKRRPTIVAKIHWYFGRILFITAVINVYLGLNLVSAHAPSFVFYYFWVAFAISIFVFKEVDRRAYNQYAIINSEEQSLIDQ